MHSWAACSTTEKYFLHSVSEEKAEKCPQCVWWTAVSPAVQQKYKITHRESCSECSAAQKLKKRRETRRPRRKINCCVCPATVKSLCWWWISSHIEGIMRMIRDILSCLLMHPFQTLLWEFNSNINNAFKDSGGFFLGFFVETFKSFREAESYRISSTDSIIRSPQKRCFRHSFQWAIKSFTSVRRHLEP